MERETKNIKLDFCELEVKTYLTWGESEKIEAVIISGAKSIGPEGAKDFDATVITEQKYVLLETVIVSIKDSEGKDFGFKREWFNNLRKEEGEEILNNINEIVNASKKK